MEQATVNYQNSHSSYASKPSLVLGPFNFFAGAIGLQDRVVSIS